MISLSALFLTAIIGQPAILPANTQADTIRAVARADDEDTGEAAKELEADKEDSKHDKRERRRNKDDDEKPEASEDDPQAVETDQETQKAVGGDRGEF